MASAIIDRLVHHATIICITGNSDRVKSLLRDESGVPEPTVNGQVHL